MASNTIDKHSLENTTWAENIQYLFNAKGQQIAVQIPIQQWEWMKHHLSLLDKENTIARTQILAEIKEGVTELNAVIRKKKDATSVDDFLKEL